MSPSRLDIKGGFNVHDYRHALKLVNERRQTAQYANREGLACPACGRPFDQLFVSEKRTNTFDDPGTAFCVARTEDRLLLLTH